jgi:hypothetical protein
MLTSCASLRHYRLAATPIVVAFLLLAAAPAALAADRIYWASDSSVAPTISFAKLDGSGGANLATTGATLNDPTGVAIDPATGRIYWANAIPNKFSFASLGGNGGGDLTTTGATVNGPVGVTIDRAAGRMYWANASGNKISFANLDGSGGGDLATTGATVDHPEGVAIDRAGGRIWWANFFGNKISFAHLDGSGGGDLPTTGATVALPAGVAVEPAAGRIYWTNFGGDKVSFANLNGSGGGGDLATTGATVSDPWGAAVDPAAGKIYWANCTGNKISFANLNGSGGGDVTTSGAKVDCPDSPALLKTPSGTGAPAISGGSAVGATLSCSHGSWAPDLIGSFLYRAPQSFAYRWSLNGAGLAGATQNSLTANSPGDYRCVVTAHNHAGSASQTSAPHAIASAVTPPAPNTRITKAKVNSAKHKAKFRFKAIGEATRFQCKLKSKHRRTRARFKRCGSPKTYTRLKAGRYLFQVRALGPGGRDPAPARKRFRIR